MANETVNVSQLYETGNKKFFAAQLNSDGTFGNKEYQEPIKYMEESYKYWNIIKYLSIKHGMISKQSHLEAMANYLLKIRDEEEKSIRVLRKIICDALANPAQTDDFLVKKL